MSAQRRTKELCLKGKRLRDDFNLLSNDASFSSDADDMKIKNSSESEFKKAGGIVKPKN